MPIGAALTARIQRNGQYVGAVKTPRGPMSVWELVESRGSSTGYMPRAFRYVTLPSHNTFYPLTDQIKQHWRELGFDTSGIPCRITA